MRTKNYTFVASGFHFSPKHFHLKDLSTYLQLFLHDICKKNKCVTKLSFLCDEINQRVKYQWRVISSEATVGRARNEVLY